MGCAPDACDACLLRQEMKRSRALQTFPAGARLRARRTTDWQRGQTAISSFLIYLFIATGIKQKASLSECKSEVAALNLQDDRTL